MPFGEDVSDHEWPEAVGPYGPYGGFGPTIMAIAWACFAVATLLILLRILTRYLVQRHAGWALSWTCLSWIVGFISQVIFTVTVYRSINGFSASWTVPTALTNTWVAIWLTFISIGIGKFAVIAFILTIQGPTHRITRWMLYFLAASNLILDVVYVFFLAFRCSPVSHLFVLNAPVQCVAGSIAARNFGYFVGSWNAATDFVLAFYPIYLFWGIQITPHIKWGVCAVMGLGIVAFAVAVTKTWDLMYVYNTTRLTYELYCILTWSYVEMWTVLITCSIPPLWPLAKRLVTESRHSYENAKGWFSAGSQSSGALSQKSRRNTMSIVGQSGARTISSARGLGARGRSASGDKDVELLKHPQAIARSVSRSQGMRGRRSGELGRGDSPTRGASEVHGAVDRDDFAHGADDAFEVYEPERGIMMARDLARPGIVVTKEYSVETERRRHRPESGWDSGGFGSGKPMRINWDEPEAA